MTLFSAGSLVVRAITLAVAVSGAAVASADAQESVSISVPMAVSFAVTDVSQSTSGTPNVTTISYNASLDPGKALRVSVQADAAAFTPPGGPSIPAANVSWNVVGANESGPLSSSSFTLVFQSEPGWPSGDVNLEWTLAAPGSGIRAGSHQLTIRWRVESITP